MNRYVTILASVPRCLKPSLIFEAIIKKQIVNENMKSLVI